MKKALVILFVIVVFSVSVTPVSAYSRLLCTDPFKYSRIYDIDYENRTLRLIWFRSFDGTRYKYYPVAVDAQIKITSNFGFFEFTDLKIRQPIKFLNEGLDGSDLITNITVLNDKQYEAHEHQEWCSQ